MCDYLIKPAVDMVFPASGACGPMRRPPATAWMAATKPPGSMSEWLGWSTGELEVS